jgi:acyl-CoA hydrolase
VADLRGKSPADRAKTLIENCAHPDYRSLLRDYVALAGVGHSPQTLRAAFAMHLAFAASGDMRSVQWQ